LYMQKLYSRPTFVLLERNIVLELAYRDPVNDSSTTGIIALVATKSERSIQDMLITLMGRRYWIRKISM